MQYSLRAPKAGPAAKADPATKADSEPPTVADDKEARKKRAAFVALIDYQLEKINKYMGYAVEREELAADAEARSLSFPTEAADKLLRYESHLDRQLYRPWTNWSVCNGGAKAKTCRRLSTSIWPGGTRLLCETKPRSCSISAVGQSIFIGKAKLGRR